MRKLFKCRKALSPVVAAIILIAVTVAVSIAVAAWMGALTFTFMKTESLTVSNMAFTGSGANITLTVKNPGTSKVTVAEVKVNDVVKSTASGSTLVYEAGDGTSTPKYIYIVMGTGTPWVSGNSYKVTLLSSSGTVVAAYEKQA
jgi:flagellin-like protein